VQAIGRLDQDTRLAALTDDGQFIHRMGSPTPCAEGRRGRHQASGRRCAGARAPPASWTTTEAGARGEIGRRAAAFDRATEGKSQVKRMVAAVGNRRDLAPIAHRHPRLPDDLAPGQVGCDRRRSSLAPRGDQPAVEPLESGSSAGKRPLRSNSFLTGRLAPFLFAAVLPSQAAEPPPIFVLTCSTRR
jgi:hypothetical protein